MTTLILIVHVIVSVLLILIVLLQIGKGASLSNLFGGGTGGEAVFTSAGGDVFLKKFTVVLAIIFFLTSLSLTIISSRGPIRSILDKTAPVRPIPKEKESVDVGEEEQVPPSVPLEEEKKPEKDW